ncbi:GAF sensor hybrid histidine kinase [Parafrankia sp. EUN1f]|nr:GAF sensor hybrid histidine kinase [Parafrankia sp. EUN1f]
MASNLTAQVRSIAQVATAVARGDLSQKITVEAKGEVAALAQTINTMVDQLSSFAAEVTRVAREVGTEGILGGQADVMGVSGTWKDLTDNVNSMANNLTSQVRNIAQVTTAVAQGDLSKKIDVDARGEILELKTTINTMVDQLSSFAAEVTRVAREVGTDGALGGQAEVEGVSGTWKRLTENVNELAGNLTRQVRAIAEVTSAVATGDLTRSITVEAKGEVAELKDNINAMVKSLRETTRANQEQDWLKTNLARVSGLMQGHRDLATVAELVMDELTPLVDAQHGTFFLTDVADGDEVLRLIASYGYAGNAAVPVTFKVGESLVGQAARTKKPILVAETPADYVRISSSLGQARPANLIVFPILFEDRVLGVIELASFTPFTEVHRDFLNQLMETIGVIVNTIIANSRTDALLVESQRLAGELQARSSELQVRQEELQRSNADLEEKAALLERQNRDIEIKNIEIEQARQEIEERAQQLALASKYKSEFLANMSHELRTPLNSLLVLARLLAQNPTRNLTPKQVEFANVIHSAGSDLLQLINDILDLSKVEAGKMDVHREWADLGKLVDDLQATFQPLTAEKGLDFAVEVAPDVPTRLFTDEQRLEQVLRNLLSNAVKFTEDGQVALRIHTSHPLEPDSGATSKIAFAVVDTGVGISDENLKRIFGAFQQGDGTTSRKYGGTGLGLSISREVAALLDGDLRVESEFGRGSTFTLYLPLDDLALSGTASSEPAPSPPARSGVAQHDAVVVQNVAADPAARPAHPAQAGQPDEPELPSSGEAPPDRRLLVLEPEANGLLGLIAQRASADLADTHGPVQVATVTTPEDAVRALAAAPHRCVVLDLTLPDASAFAFLQRLQEDADLRDVPVLAHPTQKMHDAHERLAQARYRILRLELLPSLDEVRERITLHLSADRPDDLPPLLADDPAAVERGGVTEPPARPQLRERKILVVDDDVRNVFAISSVLEVYGLTVLHASNGREGIEVLLGNTDVDLILMDVMMPEMDGYATMSAIREMPRFADLPIIAVTAKAMQSDREKCLAAGATDFVAKPVDTEMLLARIEQRMPGR